jgi:exopolysaccharide production protein ExoZ
LSFEMFFYFLFAMALALRVNVIRFLTGTIVSLVFIGLICKPAWPPFWVITQSMMLEFLAGVLVGHLVLNGYRMRPFVSMLIGVGSLTALFLVNWSANEFRVVELGVPAVLLVLCIVMLEGRLGARLPAWILTVGDISYSLYLVHMLVIAVAIKPLAWIARSNTWTIEIVTTLGQLFASIATSLLLYKFIERPLTDSLRRRLLKRT